MALQPNMQRSSFYTVEDGVYLARGIEAHVFNHGSGDVPLLLRSQFAGNNQLVEIHDPENLSKVNIRTQAGADVGIVWTQRPDELLIKCAGGTPSVSTTEPLIPLRAVRWLPRLKPVEWA
jgi:hypothetical protein